MYEFSYRCAKSVKEAIDLHNSSEDGQYMAGGHTLLPTLKHRLAQPSDVVDISKISELHSIRNEENVIVIGSATKHVDVSNSEVVLQEIPGLAALAGGIGDPQVRNCGTLGGSIANNDPAADYPAALLALDASIVTDRREIPAEHFFVDMFETSLSADEIITSVKFPKPEKSGYSKFPNPASRYAIVGVFVTQTTNGVKVAVTGAGPCVFRAREIEEALKGSLSNSTELPEISAEGLNSDMHASAEYRAHLVRVMATRAIGSAC